MREFNGQWMYDYIMSLPTREEEPMDGERETKNMPAVIDEAATLPMVTVNPEIVKRELQKVAQFQQIVRATLVKGVDYGVIPGCGEKPTLLKPGMEKLCKLMDLAETYEIIDKIEDWEKPLFSYTIRCSLHKISDGKKISEGIANCNSMEDRYRWRWVWPNEVPGEFNKATLKVRTFEGKRGQKLTKYRMPNEDVFSLLNTMIKMGEKRAFGYAVISAGRLSQDYTHDVEDMRESIAGMNGTIIDTEAEEVHPPDAEPVIAVNEEEAQRLKELYELAKIDGCTKDKAAKMLEGFGATSWSTLPKKHFETVCAYLKDWQTH